MLPWFQMAEKFSKLTFDDASQVPAVNPNAIYTVPQAAQLMQVEKRTVYNMIENGQLTAAPHGNTHRIVGNAILAAMPGSASYTPQPINIADNRGNTPTT